ncbi:hypothetical protein BGX38DRAFT_392747 [Terfezia claveryi]|nr:hypothetical protein BGX38DRAFT_392747 [Terfezia claveryi]
MVELLAYQFASPIRWIESQDVILQEKLRNILVLLVGKPMDSIIYKGVGLDTLGGGMADGL